MSVNIALPVMLAQSPIAQIAAHVEQAHPEMQQAMMAQEVVEAQKRQQKQVLQTDKTEETRDVKGDEHGQGQEAELQERSAAQKESDGEEQVDHLYGHNSSPWAGNIINVRI